MRLMFGIAKMRGHVQNFESLVILFSFKSSAIFLFGLLFVYAVLALSHIHAFNPAPFERHLGCGRRVGVW